MVRDEAKNLMMMLPLPLSTLLRLSVESPSICLAY